jgi:hypothetical protein
LKHFVVYARLQIAVRPITGKSLVAAHLAQSVNWISLRKSLTL